jgi:hypothetical protein
MLPSSKPVVRRVLALLVLTLLLPVVLPAAGVPTEPAKPATTSFWSPVEDFWKLLVRASCERGISIDPNGCPAPSTTNGCDKGISIDPNGGCAH